jgi:hypothetical protein
MPPCHLAPLTFWTLWAFGYLVVGFVKPLTLVVGLVYLFVVFFCFIFEGYNFVNNHMFKF